MTLVLAILLAAALLWGLKKSSQAKKAAEGMHAMSDAAEKLASASAGLGRHALRLELKDQVMAAARNLDAAVERLRSEVKLREDSDSWVPGDDDLAPEFHANVLAGLGAFAKAVVVLVSFEQRNGNQDSALQLCQLAVERFDEVTQDIGAARTFTSFGHMVRVTEGLKELWGVAMRVFGPHVPPREWFGHSAKNGP